MTKIKGTCSTCRKYRTVRCEERKQSNSDPQPGDWCRGFKRKEDGDGKQKIMDAKRRVEDTD